MYYDEITAELLSDIQKINIITQYWGTEKFLTINSVLKDLLKNIIEITKFYTKTQLYNLFNLLQNSGISRPLIHVTMSFIQITSYENHNFEKYYFIDDILDKNY